MENILFEKEPNHFHNNLCHFLSHGQDLNEERLRKHSLGPPIAPGEEGPGILQGQGHQAC